MSPATGIRVALPLAAYALAEWLFAYVTLTDGLVTPHGTPHLGVIALGVVYLGLRIALRLIGPGVVGFLLAREVAAYAASRSKRRPARP